VVADGHGAIRTAAGSRDRRQHVPRVRLAHGKAVAAAHRAYQLVQVKGAQQGACRRLRLVGADGEPPVVRDQAVQRVGDAWKRPRRLSGVGGIIGGIGLDIRRVRLATAEGKGALDQFGDPVANHRCGLCQREGGQPARAQQAVERGGKVGNRIDQRAVKVENQGRLNEGLGQRVALRNAN